MDAHCFCFGSDCHRHAGVGDVGMAVNESWWPQKFHSPCSYSPSIPKMTILSGLWRYSLTGELPKGKALTQILGGEPCMVAWQRPRLLGQGVL